MEGAARFLLPGDSPSGFQGEGTPGDVLYLGRSSRKNIFCRRSQEDSRGGESDRDPGQRFRAQRGRLCAVRFYRRQENAGRGAGAAEKDQVVKDVLLALGSNLGDRRKNM